MIDWENIVCEHGSAVWRTVYRILDHSADAADCYQETFLAAVRLTESEPVGDWAALLKRIATRKSIDRLRQRIRLRRRHRQTENLDQIVSTEKKPSSGFEVEMLMEWAREGLTQLPIKQAEVFWLRSVEDLSYREIADQLAIKVNEVGVLLHRARTQLKQMLESEELERRHRDD